MKPFSFGIIQYVGHIQDMHNLIKYLPPPSMKGGEFEQADWNVRDKEWNEDVISVATKYRLPISMNNELEDKHEDYSSTPHEEGCDLWSRALQAQ